MSVYLVNYKPDQKGQCLESWLCEATGLFGKPGAPCLEYVFGLFYRNLPSLSRQ